MAGPTTQAEIRDRYENGKYLNDGAQRNVVEDSPGNGADTTVGAATDVHLVNPDGTNSVGLDDAAEEGRQITVVHNGGSNTPTLSFADADFVGTGPSDVSNEGATATLLNTDGTTSGWVVVATGSA